MHFIHKFSVVSNCGQYSWIFLDTTGRDMNPKSAFEVSPILSLLNSYANKNKCIVCSSVYLFEFPVYITCKLLFFSLKTSPLLMGFKSYKLKSAYPIFFMLYVHRLSRIVNNLVPRREATAGCNVLPSIINYVSEIPTYLR